jgi:ABC-type nickel/cobalt efflux system permease component RcnA
MRFRQALALILFTGFWLSFHGRFETDFKNSHSSLAFHVIDLAHEHNESSDVPAAPQGDHKDQHGCYHSHAPFVAVATTFGCEASSTRFVAGALEIPYSLTLASILRPPRA